MGQFLMSEVPLHEITVLHCSTRELRFVLVCPAGKLLHRSTAVRSRAERGQVETVRGLLPERQRQNLAVTVLHVPNRSTAALESFRAISGRLKFTVRRHKFNKDSLYHTMLPGKGNSKTFPRRTASLEQIRQ